MAKFNIEVELDWMDYDESIDEALQSRIIGGVQDRLTANLKKDMENKIEENINKEVSLIVDKFLENIVEDKIEEIQIPHKESHYSSKVEMIPISEYIGQRFESMATEEKYNKNGGEYRRYDDKGGPYSLIEYLTRGYIAKELNEKVIDMIKQAKTQAEQTIINELENNLQQQLNADVLQRLNVPALLEKLQKTISIEGDSDER